MKWIISFVTLLTFSATLKSQEITQEGFPPAYYGLSTDTGRLAYLEHLLNDSLDENQLTHVYTWGQQGLQLATQLKQDRYIGTFNYFIAKALVYQYNKYDSAITYFKKVLPYFPNMQSKYRVFSIREIMERYAELGKRDSSLSYMDILISYIDTMDIRNPKKISLSQNIATTYQWFGYFHTAIRYFTIAIKGNQARKNMPGLGLALANLGLLYNEMDDTEKAIPISREALQYLEGNPMPYTQTAQNIAEYYCSLGHYDSAKKYLDLAIRTEKRLNNPELRAASNTTLVLIYLGEKKYEAAAAVLEKNALLLAGTDNRWSLTRNHFNFARLDTSLHRYSSAKEHLLQALSLSREDGAAVLQVTALQNLAEVCKKTGQFEEAVRYQSQYMELKDSLSSQKSKAALADLEISYKTAQKEQQIELLRKENQVKTLELRNSRQNLLTGMGALATLLLTGGLLFYQRSQKTRLRTQKERAELETRIMRLQMNPHFIFNSLNSIENFIMQHERRLASDYLNKFARLIRLILDSSRTEVVPLAKDLEALQLYIDLEQLRFSNKFSYQTEVDPALLGGDYQVPSLLIQPYVENAIVHGMAHSEEENLQLLIKARLENDTILYVVEDNGVGRLKAAAYNQQNKPYHESIGLQITEQRVRLFNKEKADSRSVRIIDLYAADQTPAGTRVEINLKAY